MFDAHAYFGGKKITVAGLGLLGRGVGDVEFLATHGAELIVTDLKNEADLKPSLERLSEFSNITYVLGGHRIDDFLDRDFILKGPTMHFDSPYIEAAKKAGIPIKMSASWFTELTNIPTVGVTGTRGKTTTTHMLYEMMKAADMNVLLGGNERGVSTLSLLPKVTNQSIALMELDSWQCEGFGEAGLSPHVSVFTSFMRDHMDYYHHDESAYLNAKANIFLNQKPEDVLVVSPQVAEVLKKKYSSSIRSHVVIADPEKHTESWMIPPLLGDHNVQNARLAIEAARALGVDDALIAKALASFKPIAGRLELVRTVNEVEIYNDTTATTPEATIAALKALHKTGKKIVLIIGGNDKELDPSALATAIKEYVAYIVLLKGTGTEKIEKNFPGQRIHETLKSALDEALQNAAKGEVILFSPAFTSFGMFKNEFDRGDQFNALVQSL